MKKLRSPQSSSPPFSVARELQAANNWTGGTADRLWFDAADSATVVHSPPVSQWNDKSGNGRHATQTCKRPPHPAGEHSTAKRFFALMVRTTNFGIRVDSYPVMRSSFSSVRASQPVVELGAGGNRGWGKSIHLEQPQQLFDRWLCSRGNQADSSVGSDCYIVYSGGRDDPGNFTYRYPNGIGHGRRGYAPLNGDIAEFVVFSAALQPRPW